MHTKPIQAFLSVSIYSSAYVRLLCGSFAFLCEKIRIKIEKKGPQNKHTLFWSRPARNAEYGSEGQTDRQTANKSYVRQERLPSACVTHLTWTLVVNQPAGGPAEADSFKLSLGSPVLSGSSSLTHRLLLSGAVGMKAAILQHRNSNNVYRGRRRPPTPVPCSLSHVCCLSSYCFSLSCF